MLDKKFRLFMPALYRQVSVWQKPRLYRLFGLGRFPRSQSKIAIPRIVRKPILNLEERRSMKTRILVIAFAVASLSLSAGILAAQDPW
jgi:hypothetical protein